ncbi:kinase-like domain-containing protein [Pestalotiopsis sp. NC0098]|nr:kinase-like domain-containing protein [Pestalotiopsis sp. NC0098]
MALTSESLRDLIRPKFWDDREQSFSNYRLDFISPGQNIAGRYKLLRESGTDPHGAVWLCQDRQGGLRWWWKTIKIYDAEWSNGEEAMSVVTKLCIREEDDEDREGGRVAHPNLCWPLDHFFLDSDSGRRLCVVTRVVGPSITSLSEDDPELVRSVCLQVSRGLQHLHGLGICHKNIRPSNICLRVSDKIANLLNTRMMELLETPNEEEETPKSCWQGLKWPEQLWDLLVQDEICITGLEFSCYASTPEKIAEETLRYTSPELLLGLEPGLGIDTWALACTMVEIRTGSSLFGEDFSSAADLVAEYEKYLGPLPEPYQAAWQHMSAIAGGQGAEIGGKASDASASDQQSSITIPIHTLIGGEMVIKKASSSTKDGSGETGITESYQLSRAEVVILGDLLCRILKYNVEERLTISEIIHHSWFSSKFRRPSHSKVEPVVIKPPVVKHSQTAIDQDTGTVRRRLTASSTYEAATIKNAPAALQIQTPPPKSQPPKTSSESDDSAKFDIMNSTAGGFVLGLALATIFWSLLIIIKMSSIDSPLAWSSDAMVAQRVASSVFGSGRGGRGNVRFHQL